MESGAQENESRGGEKFDRSVLPRSCKVDSQRRKESNRGTIHCNVLRFRSRAAANWARRRANRRGDPEIALP